CVEIWDGQRFPRNGISVAELREDACCHERRHLDLFYSGGDLGATPRNLLLSRHDGRDELQAVARPHLPQKDLFPHVTCCALLGNAAIASISMRAPGRRRPATMTPVAAGNGGLKYFRRTSAVFL